VLDAQRSTPGISRDPQAAERNAPITGAPPRPNHAALNFARSAGATELTRRPRASERALRASLVAARPQTSVIVRNDDIFGPARIDFFAIPNTRWTLRNVRFELVLN
jgi:hypothetical protein